MCRAIPQPSPFGVRRPPNGISDATRVIGLWNRIPIPGMKEWRNQMKRWRAAIRRLGIWTLALAVAGPVSLHLLDIFLFRSAERALNKAAWSYDSYGPWFTDAIYTFVSVMLSLCCWFCWAEWDLSDVGIFARKPDPARLLRFYLGYIVLNVAWEPIVFEFGAFKLGLLVSVMKTWIAGEIAIMLFNLNVTAFLVACIVVFWNSTMVLCNLTLWMDYS